jgi:hypothetical protein
MEVLATTHNIHCLLNTTFPSNKSGNETLNDFHEALYIYTTNHMTMNYVMYTMYVFKYMHSPIQYYIVHMCTCTVRVHSSKHTITKSSERKCIVHVHNSYLHLLTCSTCPSLKC